MLKWGMNCSALYGCFLTAGLMVTAAMFPREALAEENLPTAATVIQRVLRRANDAGPAREASMYAYEKSALSEGLDDTGKPIKTTRKTYQVTPVQGIPFARLIRINNRELTPEELKAQDRKEQEFRRNIAEKDPKTAAEDEEDTLNDKLVQRYDFKVEKRDWRDHRPVLVLSFRPKKAKTSEKRVEDKVLNRLAGQVWVDEAEAEVVEVHVGLTEDLALGWFGMIGSIKQCDVRIERQRLPEDVWVDKIFEISLGGRKVFSPMHHHSLEEFYNFRKL
jgi:hypothetical protein